MNAAAISVMFNISEGFLRRTDKETLQFLRYSFASNGELKAGCRWQATLVPRTQTKNGPRTKN